MSTGKIKQQVEIEITVSQTTDGTWCVESESPKVKALSDDLDVAYKDFRVMLNVQISKLMNEKPMLKI